MWRKAEQNGEKRWGCQEKDNISHFPIKSYGFQLFVRLYFIQGTKWVFTLISVLLMPLMVSNTTMRTSKYKIDGSTGQTRLPGKSQLISEKTLAKQWDCHRTTVARLLRRVGIRPYYMGDSKNGLKRYALHEIQTFLEESQVPPQLPDDR